MGGSTIQIGWGKQYVPKTMTYFIYMLGKSNFLLNSAEKTRSAENVNKMEVRAGIESKLNPYSLSCKRIEWLLSSVFDHVTMAWNVIENVYPRANYVYMPVQYSISEDYFVLLLSGIRSSFLEQSGIPKTHLINHLVLRSS